jgi:hypothetical protein
VGDGGSIDYISPERDFNYNEIQPRVVANNPIDYLQTAGADHQEFTSISELLRPAAPRRREEPPATPGLPELRAANLLMQQQCSRIAGVCDSRSARVRRTASNSDGLALGRRNHTVLVGRRRELEAEVAEFAMSGRPELHFPAHLAHRERRVVHEAAEQYTGMWHGSQGRGAHRFVRLVREETEQPEEAGPGEAEREAGLELDMSLVALARGFLHRVRCREAEARLAS